MIEPFLLFWSSPGSKPPDNAEKLAIAYNAENERLKSLKSRTPEFLIPKNNGKVWLPAFDPERIDEVAALAGEIEKSAVRLKAISTGIEAFLEITGGRPTTTEISQELTCAKQNIALAARKASQAAARTMNKNPGMALDDVAKVDEVIKTRMELAASQGVSNPQITALEGKLSQIRRICEQYETAQYAAALAGEAW